MKGFKVGKKYHGIRPLKKGGMGEVWIGKTIGDSGFQSVIAIKRLQQEDYFESHHRAIEAEATILSHLSSSPNIVRVTDLVVEDGHPHLIMEYVEGIDLHALLKFLKIREQQLPIKQSIYIINEISKGLKFAHHLKHPQTGEALDIIHRDITPSNILLSKNGSVKITDFGIAKSNLSLSHTQAGEIKGKFRYMSPEQARGEELNYRSDYFSLGLIFYECLFGAAPYDGTTDAQVIRQATLAEITIPEHPILGINEILSKLLAPEPDNRYQSLDYLRDDLGKIILENSLSIAPEMLEKYISELEIPALKESQELFDDIESLDETAFTEVLSETGIVKGKSRSKPFKLGLLLVIIGMISFVGFQSREKLTKLFLKIEPAPPEIPQPIEKPPPPLPPKPTVGSLQVDATPDNATIELSVGDTKISGKTPKIFENLPLNQEITISISKNGHTSASKKFTLSESDPDQSTEFSLEALPKAKVTFVAVPPSQVKVTGLFSSIEAPSRQYTVPVGRYKVTFSNSLAQSNATTTLDMKNSGEYVCRADMGIDLESGQAVRPPKATCKRN